MKFSSVGRKLYGVINRVGFAKVIREYHINHPDDDFSWNINCDMEFNEDGYCNINAVDWVACYFQETCNILINTIDELRSTDKIEIVWGQDRNPLLVEIRIWR